MLTVLRLQDTPAFERRVVSGKKLIQFRYDTSSAGATNALRFVVIEDSGHQYPNGRNHPVVLADLLWQFFRNKSL